MAKITISGENAFQVGAPRFCIGSTPAGYTLQYSADGVHFTSWDEGTLAETDQVVANAAEGMYFRLLGNTGDAVVVTW